jgi:hypothetical protein
MPKIRAVKRADFNLIISEEAGLLDLKKFG